VLHAKVDKVGDSTDPGLFSLAHCCSGRVFLDVELELQTAGVATATGTAPMLSARASEYLAKYCFTTGSSGGHWWLARGRKQGVTARYSVKLFGS